MPQGRLADIPLESPVTVLLGVGSERATQLGRLGIRTVGELLLHRPARYEDRRHFLRISEVREKGPATVRGRIIARGVKWFRGRTRSVFEVIVDDGSARAHCRWWNMPFLEEHFSPGQEIMAHGRVVDLRPVALDHPETEVVDAGEEASIHLDRIVPIYPLTEGLPQRWLRSRLWSLVEHLAPRVPEPRPGLRLEGLPSRAVALRDLHFPLELADAEAARRRLAFDEFLELQVAIQTRRRRLYAHAAGLPCGGDNRHIRPLLARLGFRLTDAQTVVLREIRRDMSSGRPMRRLVQGDVGSGKTIVSALAALMALESGFSVALMAPTEILAGQHALRFREWFGPLGIPVVLRTGTSQAGGEANPPTGPLMVIGTHALLSAGFAPPNLGLVVIDEQHKFGVSQREALLRKGRFPHLLVMTATPIPRTLALTLYGDLDCSVITGAPGGRGRVRTLVRRRDRLPAVWAHTRRELERGHQAYVVYPRVEEDEGGSVKAVLRERGAIERALAPYRVGLLHGRLPAEEQARVMAGFRAGTVHVLLATSIIEVGVDVPNATLLVIENAEQFGLAQLHQLRGRIGRGREDGLCVLVPGKDTPEALARLAILERSADGFAIAEEDLRLRGPGELLGQAQSGLPRLRFGDLASDRVLLERARDEAARLVEGRAGTGGGEAASAGGATDVGLREAPSGRNVSGDHHG